MGCATEPAIRHVMVVSGCLFWQLSNTFWISYVTQFKNGSLSGYVTF